MRLTDRSAHPIKTYLLSSLRVLMHVNYINLTVYSVAKTDHYKFGRASSLDETQWNRGNRSAVKPRSAMLHRGYGLPTINISPIE